MIKRFRIPFLIFSCLMSVSAYGQNDSTKEYSANTYRMSLLRGIFERMSQSGYRWDEKSMDLIDLDGAVNLSTVHHFQKKIASTYSAECRLCKNNRSFIRIQHTNKIDRRFIMHSMAEFLDLVFLIKDDDLASMLDEACDNLLIERKKNKDEKALGYNGGKSAVGTLKLKSLQGTIYYLIEMNELEEEFTDNEGKLVSPWSAITFTFSYVDLHDKDFDHGFEIGNAIKAK